MRRPAPPHRAAARASASRWPVRSRRPPDGAPVTCLAAGEGTLAAGQSSGLALHRAGGWSAVPAVGSAVHAVCALDGDRFAALTQDALAVVSGSGRTRRVKLPARVDVESARLLGERDTVLLLAGRTLWRLRGEAWRPERLPGAGTAPAAGSHALALIVGGSTPYEQCGGG